MSCAIGYDESIERSALRSNAACAVLLAGEAVGWLVMWAPMPVAWLWVGGRVYSATGSLAADGAIAFLGFLASTVLAIRLITRIDTTWVAMRRRAGQDQSQGAVTQIVVVCAAFGILAFLIWFYVLSHAFILPFMPSQGGATALWLSR